MTPHPTDSELDAFTRRTSSPAELIEIDGHLSDCAQCCSRIEERMDANRSIAWLHADLGKSLRQDHLSEETIVALAGGEVIPGAADHLRTCATCQSELEDLMKFAAKQRPQRANLRIWAIAAAILIAVLAPLFWILTHRAPHPEVAAGSLPPSYAAIVDRAVRSGQLEVGGIAASLARKQEVLLGPASSEKKFALNHPIAEAVLGGRPQFSWQAFAGASGYRVEVYDEAFHKAAESLDLTSTTWTPAEPLPAGQVYSWTVTARAGSDQIREPVPPSPEAKFGVLATEEAARLNAARASFPNEHLLLAALYAQAGVLEEARAQLTTLESANPTSTLVPSLKKSLDARP